MTVRGREKIVLLGMMGKMRVAGPVWQTLHYLVGLERLGYEVYYIEAHGGIPWAFRENEPAVAEFLGGILERFGFGDRWAFHPWSGSGSYYGMTELQVRSLYDSAAVILNLHGSTIPTPEQRATGRLVYIDTDPGEVEIDVYNGVSRTIDFLAHHRAFFTFGENYGRADCRIPVLERFHFKPTRQPVVLDFWRESGEPGERFTTVGAWRQLRKVRFNDEEYEWSKHLEFLKFLDLPRRANQKFELSLSNCSAEERALLAANGWIFRDAFSFSGDLDAYRSYIAHSRAEFTVAKDQNICMRTGWFSDRSATYLASGRPVITQETGFSNILPAGEGLFGFSTMEEILAGVETINRDYRRHSAAASAVAREYFSHEVVLGRLLSDLGMGRPHGRSAHRVNVVGYFSRASGMGTAARRYLRALQSAGIPCNAVDVSRLGGSRPSQHGAAEINLICCDVAAYFAVRSHLGEDFFRDRYNIGLWLWEMSHFRPDWHDRFAYHDEIWAPSAFIDSLLGPVSPIPVVRMPEVLEPEAAGSREVGRKRLNLADGEFAFAFIFDSHSSFERKNPLAVVDAFNAAFQPDEAARLIIKCSNPDFDVHELTEMRRRSEERRICIYAQEWTEREVSDLIAACDCYVSLHRGEGVGLTIGEAMAAGKPVIATGWSGNMDFMTVSNSFPVSFRLVRLQQKVAHYPEGGTWAEASTEDAARLMRHVYEQREEAAARGELARKDIEAEYSSAAIGRLMAERIHLISRRGVFQEMRQRLNAPGEVDKFSAVFAELGAYVPAAHLRYVELKERLRNVVPEHVPGDAGLVVFSKGDEELLCLHNGPSWHFPNGPDGKYAGFYPKDSAEAIRNLDALSAKGGRFLLFPRTAFWWLDRYPDFGEYIQKRSRVAYSDEFCRIFELDCCEVQAQGISI